MEFEDIISNKADNYSGVQISIASPEAIKSWSHGEVKKPETINYRTFNPEKNGLFCPKIFGPVKDYECACGKYKRLKHRGIVCEKCGVEVTTSRLRRERMAHIELASPIVHIWFLRGTPSRIGMILDMSLRDLDSVLYYESHVVINPGSHPLKMGQTLTGEELSQLLQAEHTIPSLVGRPEENSFFNLKTEEDIEHCIPFFINEENMSLVKDYWYKYLLPTESATKFSLQNIMSGKSGISEREVRRVIHFFLDAKKSVEKEQMAYDAKVSESVELETGGKLKTAMDDFDSIKKNFNRKFAEDYKNLGLEEIPASDKKIRDTFKHLSGGTGADKETLSNSRDNLIKGDTGKEHADMRKQYKEADKKMKKVESEGEEVPPHFKDEHERLSKAKDNLKKSREYFARIIKKSTFTEEEIKILNDADDSFGNDYTYGMGAEAIYEMLKSIDLKELSEELKTEMRESTSPLKRAKIAKRRKICETFRKSNNRPEWMVLKTIPVLPPNLRPLVPHGGRFATSDLNVLYRRVINRNNRLKRLLELEAPDIIVRNEKRMLQEAVDALFENGRRGRPVLGHNHRPLKSLTDIIKGKSGRFRQNLLGKRVDYSGRSVITVGPNLKLHQCGLPKQMALELFKPFIYQKLQELKNKDGSPIAPTIKIAKKFVETGAPVVWDALDDVIKEHMVMLNRAPTLHKLSIQAFEPVLVEGMSIRIHPLVCPAYNADFDGDQMAVHLPLSIEAQAECRSLVMSTNNILSPAHGKPVILPAQDIVLGIYYMTKDAAYSKGEGKYFSSPEEVVMAYDSGHVGVHTPIKIKINNEFVETTVGRVILYNEAIPKTISFELVNKPMSKGEVENLVDTCFRKNGGKETVVMADRIRTLGFQYATKSGISISINDMEIPETKEKLVQEAREEELRVHGQYSQGLLTEGERYNKVVDIWTRASDEIAENVMENIKFETVKDDKGSERTSTSSNPIYMMIDSGARGSMSQMRQLAGMRGLMAKGDDTIIEKPITSNFREGLKVMDYFLSTYGARKGLADTALKTANAGYLTRKLIDVAHDIIVRQEDCGTIEGLVYTNEVEGGKVKKRVGDRVLGRVVLDDLKDPETGEIIVKGGREIDNDGAEKINKSSINEVKIRSVLTCDTEEGICRLCYGRNLSTGKIVDIGEAVGIMAAQSIGEPGTQLTMRTFHVGGEAKAEVATLENNHPGTVILSNVETFELQPDTLWRVINRNGRISIVDEKGYEKEMHKLEQGAILKVKDGQKVKWEQNKEDGKVENETLAEWDPYTNQYIAETVGTIQWKDLEEGKNFRQQPDEITGILKTEIITPPTGIKELAKLNPTIIIKGGRESSKQEFGLPVGAIIEKKDGESVKPGDIVAKIPKKRITKDITGGLPRVAELFEARVPKDKNLAIVSEIDGTVSFGEDVKGKRKILVTPRRIVERASLKANDGFSSSLSKGALDAELQRFELCNTAKEIESLQRELEEKFAGKMNGTTKGLEEIHRETEMNFEELKKLANLEKLREHLEGKEPLEDLKKTLENTVYCNKKIQKQMFENLTKAEKGYTKSTCQKSIHPDHQGKEEEKRAGKWSQELNDCEENGEEHDKFRIVHVINKIANTKNINAEKFRKNIERLLKSPASEQVDTHRKIKEAANKARKDLRKFGEEKEYIIPKGKHIIVSEGDFVVAGDKIVDGDKNPHDILKIKGEKTLSEFLVKEIQGVYELQGVRVNDKHIEVIVRQMLKRVKIKDPGDTTMLPGEAVTKAMFHKENAEVEEQGGKPATAEPLLLGITRSSLSTESWLSAASFQETTKILTEAACESKEDKLKGLKENVIIGKIIPAGTGLDVYKNIRIETEEQAVPMPLVEEAISEKLEEKPGV